MEFILWISKSGTPIQAKIFTANKINLYTNITKNNENWTNGFNAMKWLDNEGKEIIEINCMFKPSLFVVEYEISARLSKNCLLCFSN